MTLANALPVGVRTAAVLLREGGIAEEVALGLAEPRRVLVVAALRADRYRLPGWVVGVEPERSTAVPAREIAGFQARIGVLAGVEAAGVAHPNALGPVGSPGRGGENATS